MFYPSMVPKFKGKMYYNDNIAVHLAHKTFNKGEINLSIIELVVKTMVSLDRIRPIIIYS